MKYADGQNVMLGDCVHLVDDTEGMVVCIIEENQFSEKFPETEWAYLKQGILVESLKFGLIHYPALEADIKFLRRKAS